MSSIKRSLQRQMQKKNGTLTHKKVVARKVGGSVSGFDERMKLREKNLKEIGEIKDE